MTFRWEMCEDGILASMEHGFATNGEGETDASKIADELIRSTRHSSEFEHRLVVDVRTVTVVGHALRVVLGFCEYDTREFNSGYSRQLDELSVRDELHEQIREARRQGASQPPTGWRRLVPPTSRHTCSCSRGRRPLALSS